MPARLFHAIGVEGSESCQSNTIAMLSAANKNTDCAMNILGMISFKWVVSPINLAGVQTGKYQLWQPYLLTENFIDIRNESHARIPA
jgi:hypothetical protein